MSTTATPPGTTSRNTMDEVIEAHYAAEDRHDIPGILETLTEDVEHDVVGWPTGPAHGYEELVPFYERLFADFDQDEVEPLRRYHGDDFMVDEVLWKGRAVGEPFGMPGNGRPVEFRLLHICEFRDGKISRENVWLDAGSLAQQLQA